jgi:mRNA-degrading endonuclease toxin of MazEF toxin-antitoxin module
MAYRGPVRRWDVFWVDLEPGVGHEQKGASRPVIVVSNDGYHAANFRMVTVVPATKVEGKRREAYPFEVLLPKGTLTRAHASIVMPQQIRSISSMRLLEKIGELQDPAHQAAIENRILEHLGIAFEAEEIE